MTSLDEFEALLAGERHLGVLVTTAPDRGDPQVSIVNVGLIPHPVTGQRVVALVGRVGAKLTNLRRHRRATVVVRAGWQWAAARGAVELSGPNDADLGIDVDRQRQLLRDIYDAAGGHHPDPNAYDAAMLGERRCAVLIHPERCWSNPAGSEHLEPQDSP